MFSEAENFYRNLHFLLLTETDGNEQLNISMQQLATSFVLKIFTNAPISKDMLLSRTTESVSVYYSLAQLQQSQTQCDQLYQKLR